MAKRKVGELFGKPIVQGGGGSNTLTVNEILLQEEGNKITLSERDSDKVESITGISNIDKIYFHFTEDILNEALSSNGSLYDAINNMIQASTITYYNNFNYPINTSWIGNTPSKIYCSNYIFGISLKGISIHLGSNNAVEVYPYEYTVDSFIEELNKQYPQVATKILSCRVYKD